MVVSELRTATKFLKHRPTSSSCTSSLQFLATAVSIFLLVFFSTVITTNLLVGDPIECTRPPESELTQEFVHAYCWNENTFSLPYLQSEKYNGIIPYPGVGPRSIFLNEPTEIHVYYQWVPMVLAIQALVIAAPQFLWKYMEKNHANSIVSVLSNSNLIIDEIKFRSSTAAKYMLATQKSRKAMKYFHWFWICSFLQVLTFMLLGWSTDIFLSGKFSMLGPKILNFWRFRREQDPLLSIFPRMVKCNLEHYGASGSLQTSDFLCFLSSSLWHSRVFFVLWWWYVAAFILSCMGFILGSLFIFQKARIYFITSSLLSDQEHKDCMKKINTTFTIHDCLVLYLIRRSLEPIVYAQVLSQMLDGKETACNMTTTSANTNESNKARVSTNVDGYNLFKTQESKGGSMQTVSIEV